MTQRDLEALSDSDCLARLRAGRVGRFVYLDDLGPVAIPVNYAMVGNDILIRVEGGAKKVAAGQDCIAFEVDDLDHTERAGWSVVVRGIASEVPLDRVPALFREEGAASPAPWALGVHNVWIRIRPTLITGRRLADIGVLPV